MSEIADGRVLSGSQAKAAKLVDELGTIDDAILEAAKLAGIEGKPQVVYPEESRKKLIDFILDNATQDSDSESGADSRVSGLRLEHWLNLLLNREVSSEQTMNPGIYWIWQAGR